MKRTLGGHLGTVSFSKKWSTVRFNLSNDQNFSLIRTLKMEAAGSYEGFAIT